MADSDRLRRRATEVWRTLFENDAPSFRTADAFCSWATQELEGAHYVQPPARTKAAAVGSVSDSSAGEGLPISASFTRHRLAGVRSCIVDQSAVDSQKEW